MEEKRHASVDVKQKADDKMHFTEVYVGFIKIAFYHLARILFNLFRTAFWILNGTILDHWRAYNPENYDKSAHVYDVIFRHKFDLVLGQSSFEDFLLTHDRFVHPMYLLRDECVLYQVTPTQAIFVQVDEGVDVWRARYGSFLRQAQFQLAKKVITVPLPVLGRLAEQLGPLDAQLVFVQNTARCGSTLLVRMFEMTDRCVTFSEPDAVNGICKLAMAERVWDAASSRRIVRSLVRVLCKPVSCLRGRTPLAYVLKMTAPSMEAAPFLAKAFPEARHLFMYRDSTSMARSLAIAAEEMPTLKLVHLLGSISPTGLRFAVSQMGCSNTEYTMKLSGHPYDAGFVLYGITVKKYLQMLAQGIQIAGIRYEDLSEDPEYFIDEVLKYCNLPTSLSSAALQATKGDAQRNSPLSISNLKSKNKRYSMTPEIAEKRDTYFRLIGIPVGEAPILPNTITHRTGLDSQPEDGLEALEQRAGTRVAAETPEQMRESSEMAKTQQVPPGSPTGGVKNVKLIATLTTTKTENDVIVTTSRITKNDGLPAKTIPVADPEGTEQLSL